MNNLSSAFKNKLISGNNKYVNKHEKKATVIEANEAENRCVISTISRDGIPQVYYNVPVVYGTTDTSSVSWFPKNGEEVMVTEKNKMYIITGPLVQAPNLYKEYDYYSEGTDDTSGNLQ